jgi:cell division protein FtsQ
VAFWGEKAMLAENGEIIKASLNKADKQDLNMQDLPMLYSPGVNSNDKGRNMATGFLKIKKWMGDFPLKMVEFKEDSRGSWQIKLENGVILKVGRDNQKKRFRRFLVGYQQSLVNVIDKISVVDLRYTNGFSVKWKKGLSADRVFKG